MTPLPIPLWLRTILGFVIAPVIPGIIIVVVRTLVLFARMGGTHLFGLKEWSEAIRIVNLSAMLGYPIAIVLGVPLYLLLRSRRWRGLSVYLAAGALQGLIVYVLYAPGWWLFSFGWSEAVRWSAATAPILIPAGMLSGAIAALCFWLIVRPDRIDERAEPAV